MGQQNNYKTLIGVHSTASHAPQLRSCNYYLLAYVYTCMYYVGVIMHNAVIDILYEVVHMHCVYMYMYDVCNSCKTLIGVHEMHGQMHSN